MLKCKYCGVTIFTNEKTCPNCGRKIKRKSPIKIILMSIVAVLILMVGFGHMVSSNDKSETTPAISEAKTINYPDEILFQGIPWGTSVTEIDSQYGNTYFEGVTPAWSDSVGLAPVGTYSLGFDLFSLENIEIAGYEVANFHMFFFYGHDGENLTVNPEKSQLYYVSANLNVVDISGTYEDLYNKLTEIYGQGTSTSSVTSSFSTSSGSYKSDVTTTMWQGQNNTAVKLVKSEPRDGAPNMADAFNSFVTICYGKTDSDGTIEQLYTEYKNYLSSEEQENRDPSNKTGLK